MVEATAAATQRLWLSGSFLALWLFMVLACFAGAFS